MDTQHNATYGGKQVPDYSGKNLIFVTEVKTPEMRHTQPEGVLVAQGDRQNGYAVYMKSGKIYFQVNQQGRQSVVSTADSLSREFTVKAALLAGGAMTLHINGKLAAEGSNRGLFASMPEGNIRLGHNRRRNNTPKAKDVADFPEDFHFTGKLENARLVVLGAEVKTAAIDADEVITIKSIVGEMKYDKPALSVKAGTTLKLIFDNPDHMQHNLLILKPGTMERVGQAADELAKQPNGVELQYIPNSPDILFSTPLVNPGERYELTFKVPSNPGKYPFICTFPGHWRIMNGVMTVVN